MKNNIITILIIIALTGCIRKNTNSPVVNTPPVDVKQAIAVNNYLCINDTGVAAGEINEAKTLINTFTSYLKTQNYPSLEPALTAALQQKLINNDIKSNGLNVFYQGTSDIIPQIDNFTIAALYKIQTNPQSTKIQGVCEKDKTEIANNIYFEINKPQPDQIAVFLQGVKGSTIANAILLINKENEKWKIDNITIFPGDIGGKSLYQIFQMAKQSETEGRPTEAYLLYNLLLGIMPREAILPEYVASSLKSLQTLQVSIPEQNKQKYQEWQITQQDKVLVYDMQALPVTDKIVLLVKYITPVQDVKINDMESSLIRDYIKRTYPDVTYFFHVVITEATREVPTTDDYQRYRKVQDL